MPRAFAARYTIERAIGRGATAVVYLARDGVSGQDVAIKVLRTEFSQALGSVRFLREIKVTQALRHPHIVEVLDSGEQDGDLYFVLPYMEGGTLRDRLNREKQLPIEEAVAITRSIADALDYAHKRNLIHRDVKPENILFSAGQACLADFGIARAFEHALDESTTSTGIIRGTPAYMSPEQASGGRDYDGRSDVYSLGLVLYEMLTGMPAFLGPSPEAVISQRFTHPPREMRVYRPGVPAAIEGIVTKAVALLAADRFATAGALADALREAEAAMTGLPAAPRNGRPVGRRSAVRRIVVGAVLSIAAIAAITFATHAALSREDAVERLDTTRVVVLPLGRATGDSAALPDDDLLYDALARWRGITIVDQFQVADALRRRGSISSLADAASLAKALGAGRFVRGSVSARADSRRAYVSLYDVSTARELYHASREVTGGVVQWRATYSSLVNQLLVRGGSDVPPSDSEIGTTSLPAVQAVSHAQRALDEWDLAAADSGFQAAVTFDPEYPRANLWLAQVRAWRGMPVTMWGTVAERATSLGGRLPERERRLADALVFLSRGQYANACRVYQTLHQHADKDFAAWFGSGQCVTMDHAVVRDTSSPSGWRFRGSYHQAMQAYRRAFEILPSVHRGYERGAFEQLRVLMLVSTGLTLGRGVGPDSALFYARPALLADTLALIPYPWEAIHAGRTDAIPPGFARAIDHQKAEFRRIASGWSAAFPASAGAKHAVAVSLELFGDPAAVDTMREARRLETDADRGVELAARHALLLLKFGIPEDRYSLRQARVLAESLLDAHRSVTPRIAYLLTPLASLLGRCTRSEELARVAASARRLPDVPIPLLADARALETRTALGCRPDQKTPSGLQLSRMIEHDVPKSAQWVNEVLLSRLALFAPELDSALIERLAVSANTEVLSAARAMVEHRPADARTALLAFDKRWKSGPYAQSGTPDVLLPAANLWRTMGDPTTAALWLDRTLVAIRSWAPAVLADGPTTAALIRAMIVRADLAAAAHDRVTATRWAAAVAELWSNSDPEFKPLVDRMSQYAGSR